MSDKPTAVWYLLPIFLGIIGSLIMYLVLKENQHEKAPKMRRNGWIIGIVLTIGPYLIIPIAVMPMFMMPF